MVSTWAQKCRSPTISPHSSISSRRAASSHVSPTSCAPPGRVQLPRLGGLPRWHSSTWSSLMTTMPIPTIGRVGYSRSLTWRLRQDPERLVLERLVLARRVLERLVLGRLVLGQQLPGPPVLAP